MDELPQDCRGRILFGLNVSVAHSTVSDVVYVAVGREAGFLSFLFVGSSFRPTEDVGPHKEIQNSGR